MKNLSLISFICAAVFLSLMLAQALTITCNLAFWPALATLFIAMMIVGFFLEPAIGISMTTFTAPTSDNIGGGQGRIYVAPVSTFTAAGITEPAAYDDATTLAEMAENADDFVFATGGCFYEVYSTENTNKLSYKEQGDIDGKSYKPEGEIFIPGDDLNTMGLARWMKNQKWIILDPMANGVVHQIGTRAFPAHLIGEWESATNSAGVKGLKIKFTTAVASGPMIYTGIISLTPAV